MKNNKSIFKPFSIFIIFLIIFSISIFFYFYYFKKEDHEINLNKNEEKNNLNRIKYPILYINLDRSNDRKINIESQMNKYNIKNYQRIQAVDGREIKNIREGKMNDVRYINNYKVGSKSELACVLSHLKAIKYAYENNYDTVLIVEDDCSFELMDKWKYDLPTIVNDKTPKDWEIIQLYFSKNCISGIEDKIIKRNNQECYGAVAYLINKKGMEVVLKNSYINGIFTLGKIINGVIYPERIVSDYFIYRISKHVYLYAFPLFITNNEILESTIHPEKTSNHKLTANYYKYVYDIK